MAIDALRRASKGTDAPVIGDPDGAIFVCTSCSRPVASGGRRCPGCGARFILDVPLKRAGALSSIGLAAGLVVGGGGVALAAALSTNADSSLVTPSAAPGALPATRPLPTTPTTTSTTPGVPPAAVAALRGTTTINGRLAELVAPLSAELAVETLDTSAVARTLRRVALEVGAAQTLVPALRTWSSAGGYAGELETFYASLAGRVRDGLGASLRNDEAYRATASDVLGMLGGLVMLDAAARELAVAAELPVPSAAP